MKSILCTAFLFARKTCAVVLVECASSPWLFTYCITPCAYNVRGRDLWLYTLWIKATKASKCILLCCAVDKYTVVDTELININVPGAFQIVQSICAEVKCRWPAVMRMKSGAKSNEKYCGGFWERCEKDARISNSNVFLEKGSHPCALRRSKTLIVSRALNVVGKWKKPYIGLQAHHTCSLKSFNQTLLTRWKASKSVPPRNVQ